MAIIKQSAGHVQATLDLGDIEIGAVELKNAATDERAEVGVVTTIVEGDIAVAMQAPVLGITTDAAVITDAAGTIQQYLRGLIRWAFERMPTSLGQKLMAASFPVTIASDQSSFPIVVEDIEDGTGDSVMDAVNDAIQTSIVADSVGLATSANQTTMIGHVDGLEGVLGVTTGAAVVTDAVGTIQQYLRGLVTLIAAKIGVTIADGDDASLGTTTDAAVVTDAAGTAQGKLRGLVKWAFERMPAALGQGTKAQSLPVTLASDEDNVNADVTSVIPGVAATSLGKAEDAQHTTGDTGVMLLGVRKDTAPTAIAGADGDYIPAIFDENGNLWVSLGTHIDKDNDEILIWANTAKDGTGTDYVPLVDSDGHWQVDALNTPVVTPATSGGGGENINTTTALATDFYLRAITIHFNGAWTNDVTVTLDATDGVAYDTVLRTLAGGAGITDMVWIVEGDLLCENGDQIVVTGTNPGAVTFGLRIVTEEA